MNSPERHWWNDVKERGESIGGAFFILGILVLFTIFALVLVDIVSEIWLLGISLGLISVGLGFIAIGVAAKSDRKHTELLERLDENVARLPSMIRGDFITPSEEQVVKEIPIKQSKMAAQRRLDEDTKRVGYVRGEIFQLEDGGWAINWGGKYRL